GRGSPVREAATRSKAGQMNHREFSQIINCAMRWERPASTCCDLKNARASWALVMAWKYEIALRLLSKQPRMKRADRPRCGARTRKGRPCCSGTKPPPSVHFSTRQGHFEAVHRCCSGAVRAGSFCYTVELPGPVVDRRVQLGWLAGVAPAVLDAFRRFVQQALGFSSSGGSE